MRSKRKEKSNQFPVTKASKLVKRPIVKRIEETLEYIEKKQK
ncbi:hypothetical protein [Radiobacillus sp. PE A8.2]